MIVCPPSAPPSTTSEDLRKTCDALTVTSRANRAPTVSCAPSSTQPSAANSAAFHPPTRNPYQPLTHGALARILA